MKYIPLCLILSAMVSMACAQETKKVELVTGDDYNNEKEVFYVLKNNDTVRHGQYKRYTSNSLFVSGWYNMGKKDSTWQCSFKKSTPSQRFYRNGNKTGIWKFIDRYGNADWEYNFQTKQASYSDKHDFRPDSSNATAYYPDNNGNWVKGKLDKGPLALYTQGEWLLFLVKNLRYPQEAIDHEDMGTVDVNVVINEQGETTGFEIEKSVTPALDKEASRIFSIFPFEFIPAEQNGHPVTVKITVPLTFKLEIHGK